MFIRRFLLQIFFSSLMILEIGVVSGQDYPNKPIRLFTTNAGGSSDVVARLIAQGISGTLLQPVVVENRAGFLGMEIVAKAAPDGYNLQLGGSSIILAPLFTKVPYDPVRDLSSITIVDRAPNILVVHPSLPVKSVKDLIALAKARPGELNYGLSTIGGAIFIASELFKYRTGTNMVGVNYKGSAVAFNALLGGELQVMMSDVSVVRSNWERIRALAVTSAEPFILFPELPTVAASGMPGFEWVGIDGLWAPAGTPAPIINRLNQEIVRVLTAPETKERILKMGVEVVASSPDQLTAKVKSDIAKTQGLIKDAKIKTEN